MLFMYQDTDTEGAIPTFFECENLFCERKTSQILFLYDNDPPRDPERDKVLRQMETKLLNPISC